jgi:hypothetical protein
VPEPDRADRVAYGEYLSAIGGCIECHTPWIQGRRHQEELMAGGNRFKTAWWTVYGTNLTPDPETGLRYDEDGFVALFRSYRDMADGRAPLPRARRANTVMPWLSFSRLEETDLRAIWAWLRSLPPIRNRVDSGYRSIGGGGMLANAGPEIEQEDPKTRRRGDHATTFGPSRLPVRPPARAERAHGD